MIDWSSSSSSSRSIGRKHVGVHWTFHPFPPFFSVLCFSIQKTDIFPTPLLYVTNHYLHDLPCLPFPSISSDIKVFIFCHNSSFLYARKVLILAICPYSVNFYLITSCTKSSFMFNLSLISTFFTFRVQLRCNILL